MIYDKRSKTCGMLSDIRLMKCPDGIVIHYSAYMNSLCPNQPVFIEDFEKGNVVFLMPYSTDRIDDTLAIFRDIHREAIEEFFDDRFREDMIMTISEEERQKQIRKEQDLWRSVVKWSEALKDRNE